MERKPRLHLGLLAIIYLLVFSGFLFWAAGTLEYWQGWVFIGVISAAVVISFMVWKPDEELIRERLHPGPGMKGWDKAFYVAYIPAFIALFALAPMDAVKFGWSGEIPVWQYVVAYAAMLAGLAWAGWARNVNRFFSSVVRIQKDRGQRVVQVGPYRYMRHPGYAGSIPAIFGIAVALGSYYALMPASVAVIALIARAYMEDEALRRELKGYREYAKKVKYRLVPGAW